MDRPLVYATQVRDADTRLPVVVIDSTALPEGGRLPDPEREVPAHLKDLPGSDFVIVFLASRAPKAPNLSWIRKVHTMLDRRLKKSIRKIYIVHAKWYTRALNRAIGPVVSPKFSRKIEHVKDLAELSRHLDITAIDFSPLVYLDDLMRSDTGEIPVPKHYSSIFGAPLTHTPTAYWKAALIYLSNVPISSSTFVPQSIATAEDLDLSLILINAVEREQRLRLVDYGPYAVLAALREYMTSLPQPLIDLKKVPLPLENSEKYLSRVVSQLQAPAFLHLDQLISWIKTVEPPLDPIEVSRYLGPSILGLRNPSREQQAIATRLIRTLIGNWPLASGEDRKSLPLQAASGNGGVEADNIRTLRDGGKPPTLPPRARAVHATKALKRDERDDVTNPPPREVLEDLGTMPRELPSEVTVSRRIPVPNRRAFGRVAEIMKKYDESQYL